MPVPFEGGCRCGAIRYRCTAAPAIALHCYCRDCQYASGGACSTAVVMSADHVSVDGAPASFTVTAESGVAVDRLFCSRCGSPLFAKNAAAPGLFVIKAASLDDPSWVKPAAHIWTDSAPPWACTADDLTKFAKGFGES